MTLIIRHMTQDDIPFVQEIAKISWHTTYEGIIPRAIQDKFLQNAYSIDRLMQRLQGSPFFVAELNGTLVGFAHFSNTKEEQAELFAIYLMPDLQNQGIGTALLQHGIHVLEDAETLTVCVEKDNLTGIHFYNAKGFKILDEFEHTFDDHVLKTVRMVLELREE
ncbi:GNAT family N-acetyltransferase [Lysinibacillus sp. NPDC097287]|uniref:GNAT family N-acetyltransferase n=1 Tax=Lysinibacillus sp. NPDC097287 TaxID=3364144 RepID=UPI0037FAA2E6